MITEPTRLLFVCYGNICRSPLAEAVFRAQVEARGVADRFEIDSAGTSGHNAGLPPDARSAAVARGRGVELGGAARAITAADLERFDYVVVMDAENLRQIELLRERSGGGRARVHRLREWDAARGDAHDLDVPDPYYGGHSGFEHVHDLVERAAAALLDELLQEPQRS
jgi:protein-tyrosine phosphatase